MTEEPEPVPRDELDEVGIGESVIEGLRRLTHEREVRGVEVYLTDDHDWPWMVRVRAARFLSDEALQDELATRVEDALRAVAGTTDVASRMRRKGLVGDCPTP